MLMDWVKKEAYVFLSNSLLWCLSTCSQTVPETSLGEGQRAYPGPGETLIAGLKWVKNLLTLPISLQYLLHGRQCSRNWGKSNDKMSCVTALMLLPFSLRWTKKVRHLYPPVALTFPASHTLPCWELRILNLLNDNLPVSSQVNAQAHRLLFPKWIMNAHQGSLQKAR